MQDQQNAFVTRSFLLSVWALEFEAFKGSAEEIALLDRLKRWSRRKNLKETSAEAAFIEEFFRDTWGYVQSGQAGSDKTFTLWPKFAIAGAGATGGSGSADLAIGYFSTNSSVNIPQAVCEFKDIKSGLDADQKRKGNTRSPVRQCLDYLSHARKGMIGSEPIVPTWALVTDMNEFRLYWYDRGHQQSVRFIIQPKDLFQGKGLLGTDEASRFDRYAFYRLFHKDTLLTTGGISLLRSLISQRRFRDRQIENNFYAEYRSFRSRLYNVLKDHNPEGSTRFPGTRGRLVKLAQKILDRLIFVFFCEDMGQVLAFPPKLLRDYLILRSNDPFYTPDGTNIWKEMLNLFHAMDIGKAFGGKSINRFNGGLFAPDPDLEKLEVPNHIFCSHMQGQNEAQIASDKETALYLCATYNFASDLGASNKGDKTHLGLYTLGRIFEQSITELEILEAEADGNPSLNKESKRKRDGVYYTPEWVVEHVVSGTIGPRLEAIRIECGWPDAGSGLPEAKAIDKYLERLKTFSVLDPACGSGAFLITVLRYLLDELNRVREIRQDVTGKATFHDKSEDARAILSSNIYGVDINSSSVEIARLALWLHTARGDKPLSSLDRTIREGNSLIGPDFYKGVQAGLYSDEEQERINVFDWHAAFPEVFARGGFDAVVGNPPYVKLQNFRKVHSDVADYLINGRPAIGTRPYKSTRTGNFDLYLPFIEKGLDLLNPQGRLGYIAPSLWIVNAYGAALRNLVAEQRCLEGWLDFRSYQVFDEAITYTALQFFSKVPQEGIRVVQAPTGEVSPEIFANAGLPLIYGKQNFGDRWLLLAGEERKLIDRLRSTCQLLDDTNVTRHIYQGLITSADPVYHLRKIGPGRYLCAPEGDPKPVPYEVEVEDGIMKPLVSGPDAKRYVEPQPETYVLFPYKTNGKKMSLLKGSELAKDYPKAWKHLKSFETTLRFRELTKDKNGKITLAPFDNDEWFQFGRSQNVDKQELKKLIVAQTVPSLRVCCDDSGTKYLNNVRVNGIVPATDSDLWYLLGTLNSPVCDFVFKHIAKVKAGGYFEANKQFIAPLPIPIATHKQKQEIGNLAQKLQHSHSERRNILGLLLRRLEMTRGKKRSEAWLFPTLITKRDRLADAPKTLKSADARTWAADRYKADLNACYERISIRLTDSSDFDADFLNGELIFKVDGINVVDRIFASDDEGPFLLAQWKVVASTFSVTDKTTGKKLGDALRDLAPMINKDFVQQIISLESQLTTCETEICNLENQINEQITKLYGLTSFEKGLIAA